MGTCLHGDNLESLPGGQSGDMELSVWGRVHASGTMRALIKWPAYFLRSMNFKCASFVRLPVSGGELHTRCSACPPSPSASQE